jgi:predicted secreted protein
MRAMENGGGTMRRLAATEWVMCSTCSGFVFRKRRTAEVVEVVKEVEKMRDLMKAVLEHGPLQEIEPAEATKEQWKVLQRRRRIMMETKKCPTCSGSPPTSSREEGSELMAVLPSQGRMERKKIATEDEAVVADARSEQKLKQSREEGSELMAVLPSQGGMERKKIATEDEAVVADARSEQKLKQSREEGKRSSSRLKEKMERKKIATEDEAMVADARWEQKLKQSREEGKRSSSRLKEKKKAKSEDKDGSGSKKKKAKRSSEVFLLLSE